MRAVLASLLVVIGLALSAGAARAMSFALTPLDLPGCAPRCPDVIVASGEITLDSDERFLRFVRERVLATRVTSTVVMSSPGGNLVGSLKLGLMLRALGFSIMVGQVRNGAFVTARCLSACAYALAGGKRRIVPDGSVVGVHRAWSAFAGQRDIAGGGQAEIGPSPQRYSPVLERYLARMGVSPRLVALADATPSSDIRLLSRAEMTSLRVTSGPARERRRRS